MEVIFITNMENVAAALIVSRTDSLSAQRRVATSALIDAEYDSLAINASTASFGDSSLTCF